MKTALELLGEDEPDCPCRRCRREAYELVAQRAREEMREMARNVVMNAESLGRAMQLIDELPVKP